jgi:hypothetical protein
VTGFGAQLRDELVAAAARERSRHLPRLWPPAPATLVAAAAAIVLLGLVGIAALGGGTGGGPAPADRPASAGAEGRALFRGPLAEGVRYRTRVLVPPVSFVPADAGWRVNDAPEIDRVALQRRHAAAGRQALTFRRVSEVFETSPRGFRVPAPDDYHGWLRKHPDLRVGPSRPTTVAGLPGEAFDVEVRFTRPVHRDAGCRGYVRDPCTAIAPGEAYADGTRIRTIFLRTSPGPLVINQIGRTAADLDALTAAAAPLLESLRIRVR